jgi:hypothetical protein
MSFYNMNASSAKLYFVSLIVLCSLACYELKSQEIEEKIKFTYNEKNNTLKLFDKTSTQETKLNNQLSIGPGIYFYNEFKEPIGVLTFELGFSVTKYLMLIPGTDLLLNLDDGLSTNIYFVPAFFSKTGIMKFNLGIGVMAHIPEQVDIAILGYGKMGFIVGYRNSIDLSVKVPWGISGEIGDPIVSVLYTIEF